MNPNREQESRLTYALSLKAQIQALGGRRETIRGFVEDYTEMAIEFYERILAEARVTSPARLR